MSVTKEERRKGNIVSILGCTAATEYKRKRSVPGAQQPQAHVTDEIVTPMRISLDWQIPTVSIYYLSGTH